MNDADKTPLCPIAIDMRAPEPSVRGEPLPSHLPRGVAEKRPSKRPLITHELSVGGHKVFVQVGLRPDRTVLEFFLDMHKEGAPFRGAAHIIAAGHSKALQCGVPLSVVCNELRVTFFEPKGLVEGHENITHAESLFDLVASVLELEDARERPRALARMRAKREQAENEKARFG